MSRVKTLKTKATRPNSFERGENSSGSVSHMEERVEKLDSSQKAIIQMVTDLSEDFRAALDDIRTEVTGVSARVNLTVRMVGNQTPAGGAIQFNKVKYPSPSPSVGLGMRRL